MRLLVSSFKFKFDLSCASWKKEKQKPVPASCSNRLWCALKGLAEILRTDVSQEWLKNPGSQNLAGGSYNPSTQDAETLKRIKIHSGNIMN